jgi:hypothetical protein
MDLFLDVKRRGMNDEVAPVLFILPAPDELGIEIGVARVADLPGILLFLLEDGLDSAVGMFFRVASSCLRVSTDLGAFGFLDMTEGMSGVGKFLRRGDAGDELPAFFGQRAEVALDLKAMPEAFRLAEEGSEPDGHGRGDGAFAKDDFVDGAGRHADGAGHGVL